MRTAQNGGVLELMPSLAGGVGVGLAIGGFLNFIRSQRRV
jgi:hypothetical protein